MTSHLVVSIGTFTNFYKLWRYCLANPLGYTFSLHSPYVMRRINTNLVVILANDLTYSRGIDWTNTLDYALMYVVLRILHSSGLLHMFFKNTLKLYRNGYRKMAWLHLYVFHLFLWLHGLHSVLPHRLAKRLYITNEFLMLALLCYDLNVISRIDSVN